MTFLGVDLTALSSLAIGDDIEVNAALRAPGLSVKDLVVEAVIGRGTGPVDLLSHDAHALTPAGEGPGGVLRFTGRVPLDRAGSHALGVRARVAVPEAAAWDLEDLVAWA